MQAAHRKRAHMSSLDGSNIVELTKLCRTYLILKQLLLGKTPGSTWHTTKARPSWTDGKVKFNSVAYFDLLLVVHESTKVHSH